MKTIFKRVLTILLVLTLASGIFPAAGVYASGNETESEEEEIIEVLQTADISDCTITLSYTSVTYDGTAKEPDATVTLNGETLILDTDYSVSYSNNVDAGTAAVIITGAGDYTGSASASFTITQADISSAVISVSAQTYTGSALTPDVTVTYDGNTLAEGTDYTVVSYSNNTAVGTASVTISGTGNYTGTAISTFTINEGSISKAAVTLSTTTYTYNGKAKKPTPTVVLDGRTLTKGTDYTVSYSNNTAAGTGTVTITGIGNYTGTVTAQFTINKKSVSKAAVTLSTTSYTYNGKARKPTPTVVITWSDGTTTTLTKNTDYTVSYKNNTNAGTATVTITGKGNYKGTVKKTFKIKAKSISSGSVSLSKTSYSYNGKSKKPSATVKVTLSGSKKKLTKNTDYTVTYKNNKSIGTATVTIKGTGNYKGTLKKTFTIKPAKVTVSSVKSKSFGKITVKWKKVSGSVTKYQIRYRISGTDVWLTKTVSSSNLSATLTKVVPKFTFEVQVRAYKTVNGKKYYGSWSTLKTAAVSASTSSFSSLSKEAQAKKFAQKIANYVLASYPDGTDLEKVAFASAIVYIYTTGCEYTTEDSDYKTAYGVFIKGVYTCSGSTRAMGLVLTCMGYEWTHKNEGQYTHQWCVLTMDGKKGYADAFVGAAGYGTWLS